MPYTLSNLLLENLALLLTLVPPCHLSTRKKVECKIMGAKKLWEYSLHSLEDISDCNGEIYPWGLGRSMLFALGL